ncbi:MAG: hypothetical protein K8U57_21995 [Planctomycetes bacterium]|nr:hypothetical protein [Planctomycetota bacterium]
MTLPETLLPKLSEWRPSGVGRHSWAETFPAAGWTVQIAADKADSMSCLVWELTLTRTADVPAGTTLTTWASAIANRVSGLMEPLKVHEVDQPRGEAVLRSVAPAKKGEALAYYEVRLPSLTTAVVRRYTASKTVSGRDQVAFALTHEAIAKLVGDIAG